MIAEALCDLIANDTNITDRLNTYEFTTGIASPAIFTIDVIPEDCGLPAIIIDEQGGPTEGTRAYKGASVSCRIRIYDNKGRSQGVVRAIATDLWMLINRCDLTLTGDYYAAFTIANAPAKIDDPDGFPGFLIDVTVNILERS